MQFYLLSDMHILHPLGCETAIIEVVFQQIKMSLINGKCYNMEQTYTEDYLRLYYYGCYGLQLRKGKCHYRQDYF